MDDGIGLAEALLGLDGFRVLDVTEGPDELVVTVESAAELVGCSRCGVRVEAQDRMRIDIRDLACFGRPARLVWIKRRWRCTDSDCEAKTWTEHSDHIDAQAVLTRRAGARAPQLVTPRDHQTPLKSEEPDYPDLSESRPARIGDRRHDPEPDWDNRGVGISR